MLGVLTTLAALAAGPSVPLPDPTCPGCIALVELVPVTTPPWSTQSAYVERYFGALPRDPKRDCFSFTPEVCRHWIDPVADGVGYSDKYLAISSDTAELSSIFTPGHGAPKFADTLKLAFGIDIFERRAEFDPAQIRVTHCGATGAENPPVHVDWKERIFAHDRPEPCDQGFACAKGSDWPHKDKIVNVVLTVQTDPATVTTCTIDFSRGSDVTDAPPIPPVTLRRYVHYFPEVTP